MGYLRAVVRRPGALATIACGAGAMVFAALGAIRPVADPDLFWHLHTGDWIRANIAIPTVDTFSHTFAGRPLHLVDWLADVLLSGIYGIAGFTGIHALAALLSGSLMLVAVVRARPAKMPSTLLALGALLIYASAAARIYSRPQTFGFLLASVQVLVLESTVERARRWRLLFGLMPVLMCLWSNLHGSSPLGLGILGIFALGDLWARRHQAPAGLAGLLARWAGLALASTAGLMLASNPLGRIAMGLALTGSHVFHSVITEWQPTEWQVLLGPVGVLSALVLVGLVWDARSVRAWEWMLVGSFAYLASSAWRFVPLYGLLAGPVGLRHLSEAWSRRRASAAGVRSIADQGCSVVVLTGAFVVAFGCSHPTPWLGGAARPAGGIAPYLFPEDGARFIARERPAGRLFNSFHWGGYLMWAVPGLPVFIDGRTETLYDESFLKENTDLGAATWRRTLAKYQTDWAIVLPSVLQEAMALDPDWATVYFDDVCAILVRRAGPNAALIERLGYHYLTPDGLRRDSEPGRDGSTGLGNREKNLEIIVEARRAVAAAPRSGRARILLANALLTAGDEAGYEQEATSALRFAPQLATVWYRVGLRHAFAGAAGARLELEHAVTLAPYSFQFREALALTCLVQQDPRAAERALLPILGGRTMAEAIRQLTDSPLGRAMRVGLTETGHASSVPR